jgi:hypothetical protein
MAFDGMPRCGSIDYVFKHQWLAYHPGLAISANHRAIVTTNHPQPANTRENLITTRLESNLAKLVTFAMTKSPLMLDEGSKSFVSEIHSVWECLTWAYL